MYRERTLHIHEVFFAQLEQQYLTLTVHRRSAAIAPEDISLEELLKKCPQAQLLLIGDGPLRSDIVAQVEQRKLHEYVKFVPDTLSVPQFMLDVMDCFVLPSR